MLNDPLTIDVTIHVKIIPGDEADGGYEGTPAFVESWLVPWLNSIVTYQAPAGVFAVDENGAMIAEDRFVLEEAPPISHLISNLEIRATEI